MGVLEGECVCGREKVCVGGRGCVLEGEGVCVGGRVCVLEGECVCVLGVMWDWTVLLTMCHSWFTNKTMFGC